MNPNQEEAYRWFRQASYDLDAAGVNAGAGFAAVACSLAHRTLILPSQDSPL
jgi:HEPN domain-containing protein